MNAIDEFRQAITAAGLDGPDVIHDDGVLHRFSTSGRRSSASSWYILHSDGVAAGAFGCWRVGLTSTWCAKSDTAMTAAELTAHRQRIQAMRVQRDAEEADRQAHEADNAGARWQAAGPTASHPYLTRKGIQAHGIRQDGDMLLIPLRDTAGKLHSLQTITPDGQKRFRGRMKGCYHAIGGKPSDRLVIAEGYATAASIHEATGWPVAVSFNAGNLEPVALALHKKYPHLTLILAADDDYQTPGNPGMTAAKQAALAVGGLVVAPRFPAGRPPKATDLNDLAALAGLGVVRACFFEIEVQPC